MQLTTLRTRAKDTEILPVVDLWYDLAAYPTQDRIPSPEELYRERSQIVK